ncbi:hypothetical protein CJU90_4580 [Yarrowia sp. C11]|nr:hypothetical protein CJU90_4580 [Yarrowia sp. C11]KAG5370526.1 hypothetical protein CKK34_0629 [Yarrowia sp. E02]
MYDFEEEAKKVIGLRDTLVKHAECAKLLTMDVADLPPSLAQFQQRYKRYVIEKRLQKDRDTSREKMQMAKHGRYDLLSDDFLREKDAEEDNDKLRAAFDLSGVQSKLVLQVEASGGNVSTPTSAMIPGGGSGGGTQIDSGSNATNTSVGDPTIPTSFTQADQPMYGDDDCMIVKETPVNKVISVPSSPKRSPKPATQSPQQQPQYSDTAPDGEMKDEEDQEDPEDQDEDGDAPPKKKRLSKKQREKRKQLQQQQLMLQYQLRQQLMGQMNPSSYDPNNPAQPPLPKQPQPPAPGQTQTAAAPGQYPFPFPPFTPGYNFNMPGMPPLPGMPPMPPLPPGMPPMPFWPNNFPPPPQPQQQQQQQQRPAKTPDPNDVYGQPSYTDN